jgi:serine-type D-ala-D-ala carboxypeptidase
VVLLSLFFCIIEVGDVTMKHKNYKVRWNRILVVMLIPIVFVFLIYFGIIKGNRKNILKEIGYQDIEIGTIRSKLTSNQITELSNYSYLSYLVDLINANDFKSDYLARYISYIQNIQSDYSIDDVIYLVNNDITYEYSQKLVDIVRSKYFLKSRLERYMKYDSDDINTIITNVNSNLDYDFYTNIQKSDTSKGNLIIVNKYYQLDNDYYYGELVTMDKAYDNKNGSKLNKEAYAAFQKLVDAGEKEGYHIRNNSAYRSYNTQSGLYNNYKNSNGLTWADKWSARPGHSEHQTGLALDVGVKNEYSLGKFESSPEFTWMKNNAHLYGFILRYPKGKEYITGYGYEPWHYRYVGVDVATYIYENNITYEEYYAYFVLKK